MLPLGVYVIVQDLKVPLIVQPQLFSPSRCSHRTNECTTMRLSHACGVSGVLRSMLAVWGTLEAALIFAFPVRELSSCIVPKGRKGGAPCTFHLSFLLAVAASTGVSVLALV